MCFCVLDAERLPVVYLHTDVLSLHCLWETVGRILKLWPLSVSQAQTNTDDRNEREQRKSEN